MTTAITVNGIDFSFETSHGDDVIDVYDVNGTRVISMEKDFSSEQIYGDVISVENGVEHTFEAQFFDFKDKPILDLVEWAIETQLFC